MCIINNHNNYKYNSTVECSKNLTTKNAYNFKDL